MTKKEKKELAQTLIMNQISIIGYGNNYERFVEQIGSQREADKILYEQMKRVAKLFGYDCAWFA